MSTFPFAQVDVFSTEPFRGNPVAVVSDARDVRDEDMFQFANWTNLSETTFVLPPTAPAADYRLRIFTPGCELPFAGHPTLGSAHAWLSAGGTQKSPDFVVQECEFGLVKLRRDGERLAFAAPQPRRTGPLSVELRARLVACLGISEAAIVDHQWVDNGPGWIAVLLGSAQEVLDLKPDYGSMAELMVGVVGPTGQQDAQFEVRAFAPGNGVSEDPVTGSLNAGLAQWLIATGHAPRSYVARQGTCLGRDGRVFVDAVDGETWIGGHSTTRISGTVTFT